MRQNTLLVGHIYPLPVSDSFRVTILFCQISAIRRYSLAPVHHAVSCQYASVVHALIRVFEFQFTFVRFWDPDS